MVIIIKRQRERAKARRPSLPCSQEPRDSSSSSSSSTGSGVRPAGNSALNPRRRLPACQGEDARGSRRWPAAAITCIGEILHKTEGCFLAFCAAPRVCSLSNSLGDSWEPAAAEGGWPTLLLPGSTSPCCEVAAGIESTTQLRIPNVSLHLSLDAKSVPVNNWLTSFANRTARTASTCIDHDAADDDDSTRKHDIQ